MKTVEEIKKDVQNHMFTFGWEEISNSVVKKYKNIDYILFFTKDNYIQVIIIALPKNSLLSIPMEFIVDFCKSYQLTQISIVTSIDDSLYIRELSSIINSNVNLLFKKEDWRCIETPINYKSVIDNTKLLFENTHYITNKQETEYYNSIFYHKMIITRKDSKENYMVYLTIQEDSTVSFPTKSLLQILKEFSTSNVYLIVFNPKTNIYSYNTLYALTYFNSTPNLSIKESNISFPIISFNKFRSQILSNLSKIKEFYNSKQYEFFYSDCELEDKGYNKFIFIKDNQRHIVYYTESDSTEFKISRKIVQEEIFPKHLIDSDWIVFYKNELYLIPFMVILMSFEHKLSKDEKYLIVNKSLFAKI